MFQKLARVLPFAAVIVAGCTPPSGEWRQPSMEYLNQKTPIEQRYLPNRSYSREALISFYTECMEITPYDVPQIILKQPDKELNRTVTMCIAIKQADPKRIENLRRHILENRVYLQEAN